MTEMKQPAQTSARQLDTRGSSGDDEDDATSTKSRPPRVNGFDAPHSRDQFISCSGHVISGLAFYVGMGCLLLSSYSSTRTQLDFPVTTANASAAPHDEGSMQVWLWVVLAFHIATMTMLLAAWISCETCNPGEIAASEPSWLGVVLRGPRWDKPRYCAICRKTVPGMDHHCTWLNTCIGRRNYAQFFTIAVCGEIIFLLQAVVSVSCSFMWQFPWNESFFHTQSNVLGLAQSAFVVSAIVSVPCLVMYTTLLAFHIYLSFQGFGTYDYFLKRRDAQRAERRKKRDAEMERTKQAIVQLEQATSGQPGGSSAIV
ncbi:hypothetical protein H310_13425 [Aphanomyces invadans]|uniref:Palmitoyltransferase n=1 Tax=Aphanomyces invadans TaxID=157072 RepID=A0A024TDP5_9STRA|nr:hypothetical protein H310_13425 [Aphanomyces invadans]ETV92178.1 hypothetical protein H310_13425 [Aphanomyces invadans]|eukprot:XP_008879142.1 hypothetical protein H310_13425 [Aphanomyces invadans]